MQNNRRNTTSTTIRRDKKLVFGMLWTGCVNTAPKQNEYEYQHLLLL